MTQSPMTAVSSRHVSLAFAAEDLRGHFDATLAWEGGNREVRVGSAWLRDDRRLLLHVLSDGRRRRWRRRRQGTNVSLLAGFLLGRNNITVIAERGTSMHCAMQHDLQEASIKITSL